MPQTKEDMKQYYLNNKEKFKAYYLANNEKLKEQHKQYKLNNKDKIKEQKKEYQKTDNGKKSLRIASWKQLGVISDGQFRNVLCHGCNIRRG